MANQADVEITLKRLPFDCLNGAVEFFAHCENCGVTCALLVEKKPPRTYQVAVAGSAREIEKLMQSWAEQSQPTY